MCCVLLLLPALGGCEPTDEAKWKEEVRLHDGRIIYVQRLMRAKSLGFSNARRGGDLYNELTYAPLAVQWHSDAPAELMSFEIFGGVPYLVVYRDAPKSCQQTGRGSLKAAFFRWNGADWDPIDQKAYPVEIGLVNLYADYWGHDASQDASGTITWAQKAVRDGFDAEHPQSVMDWYKANNRFCG